MLKTTKAAPPDIFEQRARAKTEFIRILNEVRALAEVESFLRFRDLPEVASSVASPEVLRALLAELEGAREGYLKWNRKVEDAASVVATLQAALRGEVIE